MNYNRKTRVEIEGNKFKINGRYTYEGRVWKGYNMEGLLINSRFVQAIFDDRNEETRDLWKYPDTGVWDPDRNTREFIKMMPVWRESGLLAFTLNLQGGNPRRYQPKSALINSAYYSDGELDTAYIKRLEMILNEADKLGMVVILGLLYFGQDHLLTNEDAVKNAVTNIIKWLLEHNYQNVIIEIANECDISSYTHDIIKPARIRELFELIREICTNQRQLLLSTSFSGKAVPTDEVIKLSDYILLHGNGIKEPEGVTDRVKKTRQSPEYKGQPIVFNEDDHFKFTEYPNNFIKAVENYASWGLLDGGANNYLDGYQSPPVNWTNSTQRKKEFFELLKEITG